MRCPHDQTELKPTIAHSMFSTSLQSVPAYECLTCFAIFDMSGTEISAPLRGPDAVDPEEDQLDEEH